MELSAQHRTERQKESEMAIRIIDDEVAKFSRWIELLEARPLITYIIETVERIRKDELKKASPRLKQMDNETVRQIETITKNIANKLIHRHISLIKEDGSQEVMEVMRRVFGLETEDEEGMDNRYKGQ
jgi:glutamyl-tRNA reductase